MYSLVEILSLQGWNSPNFPAGKSTGKHITSKCCCLLLMGSSVMLISLHCSKSETVESLLSRFLIVYA